MPTLADEIWRAKIAKIGVGIYTLVVSLGSRRAPCTCLHVREGVDRWVLLSMGSRRFSWRDLGKLISNHR